MARELAAAGINLNFGPVVDLAIDPNGPAIAKLERSFGRDPNRVASFARQFIDAHHDAGVLVAAKHFPGHGSAARDTHEEVVDVSATWQEAELAPSRDLASDQIADMIMVGHLIHPRFSDGDKPGEASPPAPCATCCAESSASAGLIVTDDLEDGRSRPVTASRRRPCWRFAAGADLMIFVTSNSRTRRSRTAFSRRWSGP